MSLELIQQAIENGNTLNFIYDGKIRVVEPHALGTSVKDDSHVLRAFQVAGVASRPLPQWTLFTVDKIQNLTIGREPAASPRPGYSMGDKQMRRIIAELKV